MGKGEIMNREEMIREAQRIITALIGCDSGNPEQTDAYRAWRLVRRIAEAEGETMNIQGMWARKTEI